MKIILVTGLLAALLITLIIALDMIMGAGLPGVIWKAINPFKVMEPAEYIILILSILFFLIASFGGYLNKKRQSNPPSNS
ncbi:hypothetical protein PH210_03540 [Paenibacillus sp. BSR1-1]|uniref:hypothetical protein n=1 Tax=Paenibacillus sp. BSR1-1 TaxID=3020845 RepID=UPI0025AF1483|nr:hypothetical protein [Paenibacillus sp. BSR1-1]MDN3015279.1 hypothetical protein [Paenibacillus sp. BSR1-1]